ARRDNVISLSPSYPGKNVQKTPLTYPCRIRSRLPGRSLRPSLRRSAKTRPGKRFTSRATSAWSWRLPQWHRRLAAASGHGGEGTGRRSPRGGNFCKELGSLRLQSGEIVRPRVVSVQTYPAKYENPLDGPFK